MTHTPEMTRLRWLAAGVLAWTVVIAGRLVQLQTQQHETLRAKAEEQQETDIPLQAPRGDLVDRDGRILAMSRRTESLGLLPRKIEDVESAIRLVSAAIHPPDPAKFAAGIRDAHSRKKRFLAVERHLSNEESAAVRKILANDAEKHKHDPEARIDWIDMRPTSKRVYVNGPVAAHVLGSVSLDSDENEIGREGIERVLDAELRGTAGWARILKDGQRHQVDTLDIEPAVAGRTVALTIATPLQFYMDNRLAKAVAETGSISGSAVAYVPSTGEVLGMSSYPTFDPNVTPKFDLDPKKAKTDPERARRVNMAISGASESGSVAKLFTFMAALEHTRLGPDSWISCGGGVFKLADGREISDTHSWGSLQMKNVLAFSSNVGTINIALEIVRSVGQARFREFLWDVGFGRKTGIELPDESRGILRKKWNKQSHVHHAIGYEYSATTMQLAQAVGIMANNGILVPPRIVKWKQAPGARMETVPAGPSRRVISAGHAVDMRTMAEGVILQGTGKEAKLEAHNAGGKTGTAKRLEGGRYISSYNSSFAGFAPLNQPRVVVVVTLHRTARMAADTAAPVFRDITTAALRYLAVKPDFEATPRRGVEAPVEEPLPDIAADSEPTPTGPLNVIGPRVPDLRGKDKREVAEVALALGAPLEMTGKGVVVRQVPAPGSVLGGGQSLKVQFDR